MKGDWTKSLDEVEELRKHLFDSKKYSDLKSATDSYGII